MTEGHGPALAQAAAAPRRVRVGEVEVDFDQCRLVVGSHVQRLTPLECCLLGLLVHHRGVAISREEIGRLLSRPGREVLPASVVAHVYNLRRKLGRELIETIRGRGVRLRA